MDGRQPKIAALVAGDARDYSCLQVQAVGCAANTLTPCALAPLTKPNTNLGVRSARKQIANLRCEFFHRLQVVGYAQDFRYPLFLPQQNMADAFGLSTVYVNRISRKLRGDRLIQRQRHDFVISAWDLLSVVAGYNHNYLHLGGTGRLGNRGAQADGLRGGALDGRQTTYP